MAKDEVLCLHALDLPPTVTFAKSSVDFEDQIMAFSVNRQVSFKRTPVRAGKELRQKIAHLLDDPRLVVWGPHHNDGNKEFYWLETGLKELM